MTICLLGLVLPESIIAQGWGEAGKSRDYGKTGPSISMAD